MFIYINGNNARFIIRSQAVAKIADRTYCLTAWPFDSPYVISYNVIPMRMTSFAYTSIGLYCYTLCTAATIRNYSKIRNFCERFGEEQPTTWIAWLYVHSIQSVV